MSEYRTAPRCPRCSRPLEALAIQAGSALGCDGCAGVLLDDEGVRLRAHQLLRTTRKAIDPAALDLLPWDDSATLQCPRCKSTMKRTALVGIPVDFCAEHGTWFDARELTAVAYTIAHQHARDAARLPGYGFEHWARSPEVRESLRTLSARTLESLDQAALIESERRMRRIPGMWLLGLLGGLVKRRGL
ncbi:MAG: zf-TFIIB domain-containing protein [Myxococcales bacterium]|nr:zf-TFIIB domain-containing protein [Myxococcales bacterium]